MKEVKDANTQELKSRALKRADVKAEYDRLDEAFTLLDEFLKARAAAGITQEEIAKRTGEIRIGRGRTTRSTGRAKKLYAG
jgi:hypothetical protein